MKVSNVRIYGLEESIIASSYPFLTKEIDFDYEVDNLNYFISIGMPEAIKRKFYNVSFEKDYFIFNVDGFCCKLDYDYLWVLKEELKVESGYLKLSDSYVHDIVLDVDYQYNGHINGDKLDNRMSNLGISYVLDLDIDGKKAEKHLKRFFSLGEAEKGSGHDNFLNGIIVQFDLEFPLKVWPEAQRYHFFDFVSSFSTVHSLNRFDIKKSCNSYVTDEAINNIQRLVEEYNKNKNSENFLKIMFNMPTGMNLTARMTTNYRQLKTIYSQRKNHKIVDWRDFCSFLNTLPLFGYLLENS